MPLALADRIRSRFDGTLRPGRTPSPGQPTTASAASNPDVVGLAQPADAATHSRGNASPPVLQAPATRSLSVTSTQTALPPYSEDPVAESQGLAGLDRLATVEAMLEHLYADAYSLQPMVDPTLCSNGRMYDTLTLRRLAAANGGALYCPETGEAMTVLGPVENIRLLSHALDPRCAAEYAERRRHQEVVGATSVGGAAHADRVNAPALPTSPPPAYSRRALATNAGREHGRDVPNSPPPRYLSLEGGTSTPATVPVHRRAARADAPARRQAPAVPVSGMNTPPLGSRGAAAAALTLPSLSEPIQFACGNLSLETACAALRFQRHNTQGSLHYTQQRLRMDLFYSVGLVASVQASVDIAVALQSAGLYNVRFTENRITPLRRETVLAALGLGQAPNPALTPEGCTHTVANYVADLVFILRQEDTRVLALGVARQETETLLQEARSQVPRVDADVARLKRHIRKIDLARQALPDSVSRTARVALPLVP